MPAELAKAIDGLRYGWEHRQDPAAARATLAKILRAFTTSPHTRCLYRTTTVSQWVGHVLHAHPGEDPE